MAKLIYAAIASLDGYVADQDGSFDWAAPDDELHAFFNDFERPLGTHLYGRRLYEVMTFWETADHDPDLPPVERDYAQVWQAADKIVYSRTLTKVSSARTRLEREFDPASVRRLKSAADRDLSIGGPELAGHALGAGLVDECHLFLHPVIVGGGTPALPAGLRWDLELVDQSQIGQVVHLHYRARP